MKVYLLSLLGMFLSQTALVANAQDTIDIKQLEQKVKKYQRMKKLGGPLCLFGGILATAGMVTSVSGDGVGGGSSNELEPGPVVFTVGAVGLAFGIPLAINGSKNERYYHRLLISEKFKSYDTTTINKIVDGEIWIGMTDEMARYSLGKPKKIINMATDNSEHKEKWRYKDKNLFFVDNKLTSYQKVYSSYH